MNEKFSFAYIDKVEAENAELKRQIEQMKKTFLAAMDNATKISSIELSIAERLKRESSPEALESERAANAILTEENEELKREIRRQNAVDSQWYEFCRQIGERVKCLSL